MGILLFKKLKKKSEQRGETDDGIMFAFIYIAYHVFYVYYR